MFRVCSNEQSSEELLYASVLRSGSLHPCESIQTDILYTSPKKNPPLTFIKCRNSALCVFVEIPHVPSWTWSPRVCGIHWTRLGQDPSTPCKADFCCTRFIKRSIMITRQSWSSCREVMSPGIVTCRRRFAGAPGWPLKNGPRQSLSGLLTFRRTLHKLTLVSSSVHIEWMHNVKNISSHQCNITGELSHMLN